MFKKAALILMLSQAPTIADVYAIDAAFTSGSGRVLTHIDKTLTILRADQSSVRASWQSEFKGKNRMMTRNYEAIFYLTNKTAFSGGSRSDAVKGRKVHITYHFEGDRAIADTIAFV
jgi:hypothetical protein